MIVKRRARRSHTRGDHEHLLGAEAPADRVGIVLRAGDDAIDAALEREPSALGDQIGDCAAMA